MAGPGVEIKKLVDRFIAGLQNHITVDRVYLFGSYARDKQSKFSDIDLAIVSQDFKKISPFKRLVFLGKVAWDAKTPMIEAIGYTPEEFSSKSPLEFPSEIRAHGIPISVKKAA